MKRPGAARLSASLLLVAFATTACGLFAIQNEVGLKEVGVDLTFGGTLPESPVAPTLPSLPPIPTITLPEPPPPEPPPPPPPPLCGPTTALGPRDPAVPTINYPTNVPEEGNYLFNFAGNFQEQAPTFLIGNKVISNVAEEGNGFIFSVQDGLNRIRLTFEAQPIDDNNPLADGLFLRKIEIPESAPSAFDPTPPRLLAFEPARPLRLLDFPIEPGSAPIVARAPDVAPKSATPISDPLTGAPILTPSANAIESTLKVEAPERFIVCEELGMGYKAAWDLEMTGEYNVRILGTFWLSTQYGGWPTKDEYVIIGDLIPGNFSSQMMKLDPGDYI